MAPPTNIDGQAVDSVTIDGQAVDSVTVDGQTVFSSFQGGENFYIAERTNDDIRRDSLSTPFDLSTATDNGALSVSGDARGVDITADGTRLFVISSNDVRQFDLSTPFDLSTATLAGTTTLAGTIRTPDSQSIDVSPDGFDAILATDTNRGVLHGDLSTAFDMTSATFTQVINDGDKTAAAEFGDAGSRAFYTRYTVSEIVELTLSTPFDVSTASITQFVSTPGTDVRGLAFNDKGDLLVTSDRQDGTLREFSLSTPFDISTLSLNRTFSQDVTDSLGICFERQQS